MKIIIFPYLKTVLGEVDENRVKFMSTQDFDDEIGEGLRLIASLPNMRKIKNVKNVMCRSLLSV